MRLWEQTGLAALKREGEGVVGRQWALTQRLDGVLVGLGVVLSEHLDAGGGPDGLAHRDMLGLADVIVRHIIKGTEVTCEPVLGV